MENPYIYKSCKPENEGYAEGLRRVAPFWVRDIRSLF